MPIQTQRAERATQAAPKPETEAPSSPRDALRGKGFDEQAGMLAPGADAKGGGMLAQGKAALGAVRDFVKDPKGTLYQARLGMKGRKEEVLSDGHDIASQDIVLEQLAHRGAYGSLDPTKLAAWGYREAGAAQDPESGFRAVLYVPTEDALAGKNPEAKAIHGGKPPAVLAFRGTSEKRGMQDDTNRNGVGAYQFASNEARIKEIMGLAGGKVVVTGHSLGGALAQLAATHFPGGVSRVCTFQSPGIPKEEADKLAKHNAAAKPEDQIHSTHHRAEGDLVHMAGMALTEGDVYTHKSVGVGTAMDHMKFPLARLSAARGDAISGVNEGLGDKGGDRLVDIEKTTSKSEKSGMMPGLAEGARTKLGGVIRDDSMETYGKLWVDVREMITSKMFGRGQILGVIKDSPVLKPEQKIKMRDQATQMLDAQAPQKKK